MFVLETKDTAYVISITDEKGFLGHVYYGKKLADYKGIGALLRTEEYPWLPSRNKRDELGFKAFFPFEFATNGTGDFRTSPLSVRTAQGSWAAEPLYRSHTIYEGTKPLEGLPHCFNGDQSLEITLSDESIALQVTLIYSVFEESNAITRTVRVKNLDKGGNPVFLERVMPLCLDMDNRNFEMITLHGSWARERHIQRRPVGYGFQGAESIQGKSSHQDNPFFAILEHNADQTQGDCYGFNFVYSGNFLAQASVSEFDSLRLLMGINPEGFSWKLEPGQEFLSPEVAMVYSSKGIGGMSRSFHDLYRGHLIRSPWQFKNRPVLVNNWEATYFDFNTQKLIDIAKEAAECGIEMLVMDDGWFGGRSSDNMALGDWTVNTEKLPGGLEFLVSEVNKLGLKFGIWFEPEMISPDSDLFRAHPDWAVQIPGRTPALARNQLVLDITRPEVADHVYSRIKSVLKSANIEYVKWDMNRSLCDIASANLPADRQGEFFHRYVLALYAMQEKLISDFPNLLLENCSGGGARYDAGMLYYGPQIWCSDDMDPVERLSIQEGTSIVYPLSTMGSHVCVSPNHTTHRHLPFETRGNVALSGTFGYELDITKLSEEDKAAIPEQIARYKKFSPMVRSGDYYRIESDSQTRGFDAWQIVSKDMKQSFVTIVQVNAIAFSHSRIIRLQGLKADSNYRIEFIGQDTENDVKTSEEFGNVLSGSLLMNAGIPVHNMGGDFRSKLIYLEEAD